MRHLTPEQVAEDMQINVVTVRRKCARGEIPGATRAAGVWRIPEQGFSEWLASGRPRETPGVAIPRPAGRVQKERRFRALTGGAAYGEH